MGRPKGAANRFDVPNRAQAAFDQLLDGLGIDERALQDASNETRVMVGFRNSEAGALDDAAVTCGLPSRVTLVRALVRSWLAHPWQHPPELVDHNFGDGHSWEGSMATIREEADWPEGAADPAPVFAALLSRLETVDLAEVIEALTAQLPDAERAELMRLLAK